MTNEIMTNLKENIMTNELLSEFVRRRHRKRKNQTQFKRDLEILKGLIKNCYINVAHKLASKGWLKPNLNFTTNNGRKAKVIYMYSVYVIHVDMERELGEECKFFSTWSYVCEDIKTGNRFTIGDYESHWESFVPYFDVIEEIEDGASTYSFATKSLYNLQFQEERVLKYLDKLYEVR